MSNLSSLIQPMRSGKIGVMNGLILETSTEKGLLIFSKKENLIASLDLPEGPELSKNLACQVQQMLKNHSFQPDFISIGTGPGSYTGVRVGAALANALAYGWNIPLFSFCSMKAFIPKQKKSFAVLVDARIGGLYILTHELEAPLLMNLDEAKNFLAPIDLWVSPHPKTIQKRMELKGNWTEAHLDVEALILLNYHLFLKGSPSPLILPYLSSP